MAAVGSSSVKKVLNILIIFVHCYINIQNQNNIIIMNNNICIFINKQVKTNLLFNPECFAALFPHYKFV